NDRATSPDRPGPRVFAAREPTRRKVPMSLSRRSRIAWTLTAAQVVISAPAMAQVGAAVVTGKVVDASNQQGVGDVVVTVTSPALQGEQMAVTDASGAYRIPNLPPGPYEIRAE